MTERQWAALTTAQRAAVLSGLPDAKGIDPDEPWAALPYWLRRHIAHYVKA